MPTTRRMKISRSALIILIYIDIYSGPRSLPQLLKSAGVRWHPALSFWTVRCQYKLILTGQIQCLLSWFQVICPLHATDSITPNLPSIPSLVSTIVTHLHVVVNQQTAKTTTLNNLDEQPLPYLRRWTSCPSSLPHKPVTAPSANRSTDAS